MNHVHAYTETRAFQLGFTAKDFCFFILVWSCISHTCTSYIHGICTGFELFLSLINHVQLIHCFIYFFIPYPRTSRERDVGFSWYRFCTPRVWNTDPSWRVHFALCRDLCFKIGIFNILYNVRKRIAWQPIKQDRILQVREHANHGSRESKNNCQNEGNPTKF